MCCMWLPLLETISPEPGYRCGDDIMVWRCFEGDGFV